jgi:hypothetical protein
MEGGASRGKSAVEPDVQISRIRLSDKTSRLHPRHVVPKPAQAYEPEVPVALRASRFEFPGQKWKSEFGEDPEHGGDPLVHALAG